MASVARLQDWDDRRDAPRRAVRKPAIMLGDWFSCGGTLLNISRSGAMLDTRFPPAAGRDVTLRCDDIEAVAHVVWVRDGRLGLAFDTRLEENEISELVA